MTESETPLTHIYTQASMDAVDVHTLGPGQASVFSMHRPDGNGVNEDAAALFSLDAQTGVLLVADGVGGQPAGEDAARSAIGQMQMALKGAAEPDALLRTCILDGFEKANQAVMALGTGAATTLVAVEIQGRTARTYHVGDSAVLLVGQRGKIKWETIPHSPVGHAVESGMLDQKEAMHHEDRHIVSNLVGYPDMRIEIGPTLQLALRDTLLLASDGLFDNLHTYEMIEFIRKGPLKKSSQALAQACQSRMAVPRKNAPSKPDDVTCILYRSATA